jgi:membrane protease YdiL (CAAX protease family)
MSVVAPAIPTSVKPTRKPRVWKVFVLFLGVLVGGTLAQLMAVIMWSACQGFWLGAHGVPADQIGSMVADRMAAMQASPWGIIAFVYGPFQLIIALAAVLPALRSAEGLRARLGMVRPALPAWALPLVAVGLFVPLAVGMALATRLVPLDALRPHYDGLRWAGLALFATVVPPFVEEMFFRGYVQRRLLSRWSPWLAIPVTSALFALSHGNLPQACFTFTLGLWLGVLAWRTGSVWPGMICHAVLNGTWQLWAFATLFGLLPATLPLAVVVPAAVLIAGCFLMACWVLVRRPEGMISSPAAMPMGTAA